MKKATRLLSLLMMVVMLFSLCSVTALKGEIKSLNCTDKQIIDIKYCGY